MGDTFHTSRPDALSVAKFREAALKLIHSGLSVFAIQGQHDRSVPPWTEAIIADSASDKVVHHVHKRVFHPVKDGPPFYGLDNGSAKAIAEDLKALPLGVEALVAHQTAKEVFDLDGAWNIQADQIPEYIRYAFLGDYHVPTEFKLTNGGRAIYSGSPYVCSITEREARRFLDVTLQPDGSLAVESIPLVSRTYIFIRADTPDALEHCLNRMQESVRALAPSRYEEIRMPVVVLDFDVSIKDAAVRAREACDSVNAYLWLRPMSVRQTGISWSAAPIHSRRLEAKDCVGNFIPAEDPAHGFTQAVLAAEDAASVITELRKKVLQA